MTTVLASPAIQNAYKPPQTSFASDQTFAAAFNETNHTGNGIV